MGYVGKPDKMQIETQRLILREFQQEDLRELAPILANPQVMEFSPTGVLSSSQTHAKIQGFVASYQKFGFGKWAVTLKESGALIGYCGIAIERIEDRDEPEIGYRLDSRFWGQGLATEAAGGAITYGFEQFKFLYVLGIVEQANTASVRVLEKLGMRYQRPTLFHGRDMDIYQIDASA
jgi:RimJ/RimL family protein N-acetyltransferase